jgi:hypothetical protein
VVVDVVGAGVLGFVDVVVVVVVVEPVEVLVGVVVVVVGAGVLTGVLVAAGGGEVVIGAATGFLMTVGLTGRRCCPFGPEAEATAPKLMVAASAAVAAARRNCGRICRNIPLFVPGVGPLGRELRD